MYQRSSIGRRRYQTWTDSFEIEGILNRLGGWTRFAGNKDSKTRCKLYDPQKTFVRNTGTA